MKRVLFFIMCFISVTCSVQAMEFEAESGSDGYSYTITGTTQARKNVTLRVLYLGEENENLPDDNYLDYLDYLDGIDSVKSDRNGIFSFVYNMGDSSGFYNFTVTDSEKNQKSITLEWLSPTYKSEKIELLNGYINDNDIENVKAFLVRYKSVFGLSNDYFECISESGDFDKFVEIFISEGNVTEDNLANRSVVACIFEEFSKNDCEKSQNVLEYFSDDIGLSENPAFDKTFREGLSAETKNKIIDNISVMPVCEFNELAEEISKIIILDGVRYSDDWGNVQNLIEVNAGVFDRNVMEDYKKLKDKYPSYYPMVAKAVMGGEYKTYEELEKDIKDNIEEAENEAQKVTRPSGGGSSGGGGGVGNRSPIIISPGTNLQNEEELTPPIEESVTFSDLVQAEWAREAVEALAADGIISGRSDDIFAPQDIITREEFIAILIRALGLEAEEAECDFIDVDKNAWYYPAVASAYFNGITAGMGDGSFGTGRNITREELCVMCLNGIKKAQIVLNENISVVFDDFDTVSDYAKDAIKVMSSSGIISGMGNGNFEPKNTATRAQAAVIIYKIVGGEI